MGGAQRIGDGHALAGAGELYARERERIRRVCLAIMGDENDAEDMVQETFARVAPHLARVDRDAGRYLQTVARNLCRDELRRRRRLHVGEVPGRAHDGIEERVVERGTLQSVWHGLSPRDRTVLRYVASGLSNDEIAGLTGNSANAAAQMVSRARRRARLAFERLGGHLPAPVALRFGAGRHGRRAPSLRDGASQGLSQLQHAAAIAGPALATAAAVLVAPLSAPAVPALSHAWAATVAAGAPGGGTPPAHLTVSAGPASVDSRGTGRIGSGGSFGDPSPAARGSASPSPGGGDGGLPGTAQSVVQPDAPTDSTSVIGFAAAPDYGTSHTVFASGFSVNGCAATCPILWRSDDGASSWTRLNAVGWNQCTPVLSPGFAGDGVILGSCGTNGGLRSNDGGQTFTTILAASSEMVPDGSSPPGDPRVVVIAQSTILVYHVATRVFEAAPALPGGALPTALAVDTAGGDLLVATVDGAGNHALVRCAGLSCRQLAPLPWAATTVLLSPSFATDGTLIAGSGDAAVISHDGGGSVSPLPVGPVVVGFVQFTGASRVMAVTRDSAGALHLLESADGGRGFADAPGTTALLGRANLVLPDGRYLVGFWSAAAGSLDGIRCSADGARSWRSLC